ncbi:ChbG/HpnK family deacetylase [Treponema socranskii]|uniref:ChbG/HpnK family deacetylase n=1 Tax=Treponema socranskii TaxID=53419 RepID=UPI003D6E66DF
MIDIDIHADDYALSEHSDKDILFLCQKGYLNGVSVIPNMPCFNDSVERYKTALCGSGFERKKLFSAEKDDSDSNHFYAEPLSETAVSVAPKFISVHLNFMEGACIAGKENVPHLVDENGYFNVSWLKLLLWSYVPVLRGKIKKELSLEIIFQTQRLIDCGLIDKEHLRFDSHQHPHMIPVVFDSLLDAIEEKNGRLILYAMRKKL